MSSKVIDPARIANLIAMAEAARDEIDEAAALHESWKIMAYDEDLHERMGRSHATTTFILLRSALRREVILSLMKLWDKNKHAVSMYRLIKALDDPVVIEEFANRVRQHWARVPDNVGEGLPEPERERVRQVFACKEAEFGERSACGMRGRAAELRELLRRYEQGGDRYSTLEHLKRLRDKSYAHRQVVMEETEVSAVSRSDEAVEQFFQDMCEVIHRMYGVVKDTDYRPNQTATLHQKHAILFWHGVRGERTEGHPDYRQPPES